MKELYLDFQPVEDENIGTKLGSMIVDIDSDEFDEWYDIFGFDIADTEGGDLYMPGVDEYEIEMVREYRDISLSSLIRDICENHNIESYLIQIGTDYYFSFDVEKLNKAVLMTLKEITKKKLLEQGFSFNEELTRISYKLEEECQWGEHPEEGDDAQGLLETILGHEPPIYKMGDIYDDGDYNYINWTLTK